MPRSESRRRQEGQVLVLFVIGIFAIIAMVGLVLDGGSAFAQRRDEQNVADLAALAGATAYLNTTGTAVAKTAAADSAARQVAATNGYTHGTNGATVTVTVTPSTFSASVKVDVSKPHRNNFAAIVGMSTWPVSVTATAMSSDSPNGAVGALPLLFNEEAFPAAACDESAGTCTLQVYQQPGAGNEDVPQDGTQFNWTVFCTANGNSCNANSNDVRDLINGFGTSTTVYLDDAIGPLNNGAHTTLFNALEQHIDKVFPVPIVDDDGDMVGFAYFKLKAVEGASDKVIKGYFVSPVNADKLVVNPSGSAPTLLSGAYVLKLTN